MHRLPAILATSVLVLPALVVPAVAAAAEPIPPEPGTIILERPAATAIVADVDGDGIRDLVRVVPSDANPANVAVDVVHFPPEGAPAELAAQDLFRVADVDEQLGGGPPAQDGLLPVRGDDAARLVVWHEEGEEHVVALAIGRLGDRPNCCLTAWLVGAEEAGTTLTRMPGTYGTALFVRVADLDADGTDELVVTSQPDPTTLGRLPLIVYRWNGSRFTSQTTSIEPAEAFARLISLGDSDGRPGEEVGVLGELGASSLSGAPVLSRISLDERGRVHVERAGLPFGGTVVPLEGPDGTLLALASQETQVVLLRWPATSSSVVTVASSLRRGTPLAVLGSGQFARLLLRRVEETIDVLGPDLTPAQGVLGLPAAAAFRDTVLTPYAGTLPGGTAAGQEAYIFNGRLVASLSPDDDRGFGLMPEVYGAAFPDSVPVGLVGWELGQIVVAPSGQFDAARDGGDLSEPLGGRPAVRLAVAPSAVALTAEAADGALDPTLEGAVLTDRQPSRPIILSTGAFQMSIDGPPGTRVVLEVDGAEAGRYAVGQRGGVTVPVRVSADAPDGPRHLVRLLAITPLGHGYGGLWELNITTDVPMLSVAATTVPFAFSSRVTGRTAPGAMVTVEGQPVATAADGSFSTEVGGGLVPRLVTITAVDALGNRSESTVSVLGFVDYRNWPWIPIVVALTVVAAVVLYLRVPKPSPPPPGRPEDGVLEELN